MDVTPQELRDIDIRESFRGYHRDEVDELLERAAATIEHLEHQIRILQERLAAGPAPQPVPQPAPQPAPAPAARPVPVPDSDVIQRTLILAQRAADEAVTEAQARAQQLMSDSESKAQALVSEAESTARRIAETERRRVEAELAQLGATRDALTGDVDALERFAAEYRERIRRAIEAELAHLSLSGATEESLPARPVLKTEGQTFTQPAPAEPAAPVVEPAPPRAAEPEPTAAVEAVEVAEVAEESWSAAAAAGSAAWSPEPAGGWAEATEAASYAPAEERASVSVGGQDEFSDSLDDDAFFASLRDAVRDDEPLGPRDDSFYDEDDTDAGRKLFRRRR